MTLAEIERYIASKKRMQKLEAQEKASYDYILADLIGKSIARLHSSSNKMPDIAEVYPTIFDNKIIEENKREKKIEISALRFKQFANSYNARYREAAK